MDEWKMQSENKFKFAEGCEVFLHKVIVKKFSLKLC